jgi:uncharacterized protein (TIGR03118 family)
MRRIFHILLASFSILAACPVLSVHAQSYQVTNLVSDGSVTATTMDPNFLNPWAMSVSTTWWISTANSGLNYVVPSATNAILFKVAVAPGSGSGKGAPAGSVTTSGASGMLLSNGAKASFLFSTLDGTISGWNGALGQNTPTTLIAINNSSAGASYPGLAILNVNATTSYIIAPNFGAGNTIEVYDQTFKPTKLTGSFTDPNLPSGYAPWSVHILNNQIWVAYALRGASAPYVPTTGAGNGIVDVFDTSGNFVARAVTGGNLNAPWGVAFAPSSGFGIFSGDLLIGNFGDGTINVYDPKAYSFLGQLVDSTGKSLNYPSLWELLTGGTPVGNSTAVSGGLNTNVYFTAGLANEAHGLLGAISNGTVSGATPTFGFSSSTSSTTVNPGGAGTATLSIAPVNGFNGTVTFACSGLPAGATCLFAPSSLPVVASAPAIDQLSISTTPTMMTSRSHPQLRNRAAITLASLLPLSVLIFLRRRTSPNALRFFGPLAMLTLALGASALVVGCGNNSSPPSTPAGTSSVTVTATSGSVSQKVAVSLVVQ